MICDHCNEPMLYVGFDAHHQVKLYHCGCCVPLETIDAQAQRNDPAVLGEPQGRHPGDPQPVWTGLERPIR